MANILNTFQGISIPIKISFPIKILFFPFLIWLNHSAQGTTLSDYYQENNAAPELTLLEKNTEFPELTLFKFNFKSVLWPTRDAQWHHQLNVYVPKKVLSTQGILFVNGGINRYPNYVQKRDIYDNPAIAQGLYQLAASLSTIIIELKDIPNQYASFEPGQLVKEDFLVAYTWLQAMNGKGCHWPAQLPMAKSTSLAIDAFEASSQALGLATIPKNYLITGLSKRGWSSWLTMLEDKRISAILPGVIGILDTNDTLLHIKNSLGRWPEAFFPYVDNGISDTVGTEPFKHLMQAIDPWQYKNLPNYQSRFDIPKLFLIASNDEFFVPDSQNQLIDRMPGKNYYRVLPNESHYLDFGTYLKTTAVFYQMLAGNLTLPDVTWSLKMQKLATVSANQQPLKSTLWVANNPQARDFRKTIGIPYKPIELTSTFSNEEWVITLPKMALNEGYTAHFVELTFAHGVVLTTPVFISPDTYPN